jgi:hypothetical protein
VIHVEVEGRYLKQELPKFTFDCNPADAELLLTIADDAQGPGFHIMRK